MAATPSPIPSSSEQPIAGQSPPRQHTSSTPSPPGSGQLDGAINWIAGGTMVLAAVAMVPVVARVIDIFPKNSTPTVMLSTALLTSVVAWRALRAKSPSRALWWTVGGSTGCGALNVGLALALLGLFQGDIRNMVMGAVLGPIFGLVIGSPIGLAYGLGFLTIVLSTRRARSQQSLDRASAFLMRVGSWLAIIGALAVLTVPELYAALCGLIALFAGLAMLLWGAVTTVIRRVWLHRVRTGKANGWRIRAFERSDVIGDLPLWSSRPLCDEVVEYVEPSFGRGPYRAGKGASTLFAVL